MLSCLCVEEFPQTIPLKEVGHYTTQAGPAFEVKCMVVAYLLKVEKRSKIQRSKQSMMARVAAVTSTERAISSPVLQLNVSY